MTKTYRMLPILSCRGNSLRPNMYALTFSYGDISRINAPQWPMVLYYV